MTVTRLSITPPLLFLFLAWRQRDAFTLALLCGAIPVVAALLLFRATGYFQFGNRYLLDAMPLLLLLVAAGMKGRLSLAGGVDLCLANPGTSELEFVSALDRAPGGDRRVGRAPGASGGRRWR